MDVLVVADGHYYRTPNGDIYVESVFDYNFYKRYLMTFEKVYAVGRVKNINEVPKAMKKANGEGVIFLDFPSFKGPWQYLKYYKEINKLAIEYSKRFDCAIFRLPGATANIISKRFSKLGKPFAIEVVVDPWEYFSKGTVKSITRPLVRINWTLLVKKMSRKANGVSYVTEHYLQNLYPSRAQIEGTSEKYFEGSYSSVEIKDGSYGSPKKYSPKKNYIITHVANSFSSYGKGHIPLIKALKLVLDHGYNVEVKFIGDGPLKNEFVDFTKKLGIENRVKFIGRLPSGDEVRKVISDSDLFVFPTRAEGLPRVLLEAMAEGLPCISSPVCGIPEILSGEFLCDYDDYENIATKIIGFIENPTMMEKASMDNLNTAKKYSSNILNKKRQLFYGKLKKLTENS